MRVEVAALSTDVRLLVRFTLFETEYLAVWRERTAMQEQAKRLHYEESVQEHQEYQQPAATGKQPKRPRAVRTGLLLR
jgi:hypothetical protein